MRLFPKFVDPNVTATNRDAVECDEPARVLIGEKIDYGLGFE